ncbi:GAF domain-containing protein [Microcoleus sp. bin38.metabat.b11b12b14.051]|uniref:GAF domain-containing protein n=1 Tax=Microcoleus sp. bin38.metabat.b11b12b14.051 TaxID=2742709 RepID=UPI0025E72DBB|nr:GAF domain-containing protein [Microcoleus sp. bin38.metabat.b11b12b14.051]
MNPLNQSESMQQLQSQLAQLKQENAQLRCSKARDRLNEATATAAKALLTVENLDEAVNSALQIIGECLETDRLSVIDHFDSPSQPLPCWKLLYEWNSPHTVSQISHPEAAQGTYEGIEDWYERLSQGQGISYLLENMPEPFRSGQAAIGVKALHVVPIFVESQFWGMVGFDDCREAKHRSSAELAILKTAAACIGSAIRRERLRQAALRTQKSVLQAEQERVAQLEAQNRLLENRDRLLEATAKAVNASLTLENFDEAVNSALQILGEASGCDRINILENFLDATSNKPAYHTVIYEWVRQGTVAQISHLKSGSISSQGIEEFMERYFDLGDGFGGLIDEWDEPLRSAFKAVQVQSTYSTPIRVNGQWWGVLCFDYCQEPIRVSRGEVAVLKTIADCIGSAIRRDRTQKAILQAEQQRVAELEAQNQRLEKRDRILEATATAANALLIVENLDEAINTALQIIGECLETDRLSVIENFTHPNDSSFPWWRVLYEWNSLDTVPQISHAEVAQGTYKEIEEWYGKFSRGEGISYLLEEMPEPFRSGQAAIGVKALHIVPIFIERQFWGVVGLDDCREAKHRDLAELTILKTAAACIGSAIERQRTQKAILQAEQERAAELERINAELQRAIAQLAESEKRYRTLFELSSEGIHRAAFDEPIPVTLPVDEQVELSYRYMYIAEANAAFAAMYGYDKPEDVIGFRMTDVHVANSEKNKAFMRAQIEGGYRIRNAESEEVDRNGRKLYFLNNTVCTIEDGYLTGGWGTQTNITELREAQQTLLRAEQARAAELTKANEALKQSLDVLATEPDLDRFLGHVLGAIATQFQSPLTEYWYHPESNHLAFVGLSYYQGQLLTPEAQPGHPGTIGMPIPPELANHEDWRHRQDYSIYQGMGTDEDFVGQWIAQQMGMDASKWYVDRGVTQFLNVPLNLGDRTVGALAVYLPSDRQFTTQQIELAQALAHQVTLAVELTRLAAENRQAAILEERNRMARDIHDSLAQSLTGVVMQLNAATEFLDRSPDRTQACITRAQDLAKQGLAEARRSVWLLYYSDRAACGLADSLTRLVEQMTTGATTRITVSVDGTPYCLDATLSMNLLRIAQESLTNALRHAQPQNIHLELTYSCEHIQLRICDDGCGFNPQQTEGRGLGLVGMSDRAGAIGAQLQIRSKLGAGTETIVTVAIAPP